MSAEHFIAAARTAPQRARAAEFHPYNCHAAGIHWALVALGKTHKSAESIVERATSASCLHCRGQSDHKASLSETAYGQRYCFDAAPLDPSAVADLTQVVAAGDVLLFEHFLRPMHTMVVVRVTANDLFLRGFNNASTFADAHHLRGKYDDEDRPLSSRNYPDIPLYRVPCLDYLARVDQLKKLVDVSTMPKTAVIDFRAAAQQRAGSLPAPASGLQGAATFDA